MLFQLESTKIQDVEKEKKFKMRLFEEETSMAYSEIDCNLPCMSDGMEITSLSVAKQLTENHVVSENDDKLYGPL